MYVYIHVYIYIDICLFIYFVVRRWIWSRACLRRRHASGPFGLAFLELRFDLRLCSHRVSPSSEQKGFESSGLGGQGSPKEKRLAEKKGQTGLKQARRAFAHFGEFSKAGAEAPAKASSLWRCRVES